MCSLIILQAKGVDATFKLKFYNAGGEKGLSTQSYQQLARNIHRPPATKQPFCPKLPSQS